MTYSTKTWVQSTEENGEYKCIITILGHFKKKLVSWQSITVHVLLNKNM